MLFLRSNAVNVVVEIPILALANPCVQPSNPRAALDSSAVRVQFGRTRCRGTSATQVFGVDRDPVGLPGPIILDVLRERCSAQRDLLINTHIEHCEQSIIVFSMILRRKLVERKTLGSSGAKLFKGALQRFDNCQSIPLESRFESRMVFVAVGSHIAVQDIFSNFDRIHHRSPVARQSGVIWTHATCAASASTVAQPSAGRSTGISTIRSLPWKRS